MINIDENVNEGTTVTNEVIEHTTVSGQSVLDTTEHVNDPPHSGITTTIDIRHPHILQGNGVCNKCSTLATGESLEYYICKNNFHARNCGESEVLCTTTFFDKTWKSLNANYPNFKWICDFCLCDLQQTDRFVISNRLTCMQESVDSVKQQVNETSQLKTEIEQMKNDMSEIKDLLKAKTLRNTESEKNIRDESNIGNHHSTEPELKTYASCFPALSSDFKHTQALESKVKAPAVIRLKSKTGASTNTQPDICIDNLEKMAIENSVPVKDIVKKAGEMTIVLPNTEQRDKFAAVLKNSMLNTTTNITTPVNKLPTITVCGFSRKYEESEYPLLISTIKSQNATLAPLIDDQAFHILFVKNHRNDESLFQAVIRVSNVLRQAIVNLGNRIYIGLTSCTVYDRFYIRRCNRCQEYGHYSGGTSPCTKPHVCGHCSENHDSNDCPHSGERSKLSCVNCKANKLTHTTHNAFSPDCPSYKNQQAKLQKSIPFYNVSKNL